MENDLNSTYCESCGARITVGQCPHGITPPVRTSPMKATHGFAEGALTLIDTAWKDGANNWRSYYESESLPQIRLRYPKAEVVEIEPWCAAKEKAMLSEPVLVNEDRFMEMLEVLPPQNWQQGHGAQSFELCEHTSGNVTCILVQVGANYFEFQGLAGSKLEDNVKKCQEFYAKYEKARNSLVAGAASAIEEFGEDEMERYAAEQERKEKE